MADEEEQGFTFVDKRRTVEPAEESVSPVDSHEAGTASAQAHEPAISEAADASIEPGELPKLDIRDRLLMCVDIMNQGAWISLGLLSDPATGQIETDLDQAHLAIDVVAFLADKVEQDLDETTRRELRTLVRDLRLNYVQQKGSQ